MDRAALESRLARGRESTVVATGAGLYYVCAMKLNWPLIGGLALSLAACVWLYAENRSLSEELAAARAASATESARARADLAPADEATPAESTSPGDSRDESGASPSSANEVPLAARGERPSLSEAPEESRQEVRKRRMEKVTALFGRLDGETEDEYRERMVPFVKTTLAIPRNRLEDARREAEEAAGVTDEQRQEMDAVFDDAFSEALALTNRAIESGDLSPYQRNWSGFMNVTGGLGAVLQGTESRIGEILSAEQVQTIYEQGFEWGEYLGVTLPWEQLNPPPPPPGG